MQLAKGKCPSVVAGLVAALTFGVTLASAPASALAEEPVATEVTSEVLVGDAAECDVTESPDVVRAIAPEGDALADLPSAETVAEPEEGLSDGAQASVDGELVQEGAPSLETGDISASGEDFADSAADDTSSSDVAGSGAADPEDTVATGSPVAPSMPSHDEAEAEAQAGDSLSMQEDAPTDDVELAAEDDAELASVDEAVETEVEDDTELQATHQNQWVSDGKGSYRWYDANGNVQSGWLVTDVAVDNSKGGLQRYWLGDGGSAVMGLFEAAINGISSWFFGTDDGYVVRGSYIDPDTGNVYLADNDGRLANPGWVVSDAYGQGIQRYWVDEEAHAAVPGFSEDGWAHYTTDEGYVLRGGKKVSDGTMRYADNDGRLKESGWLVTDAFGQGLQRYWLEDYKVATDRLISADEAGWDAYATSDGYVVRGGITLSDGTMRYADNDGRLKESGWLVTDAFGQGLQRYWLSAFQVVKDMLISASEAGWEAYATDKGYVLRGSTRYGDGVLLANNDGKLEAGTGWLVTDAYAGSLQRYFLTRSADDRYSYATIEFFQASLAGYADAWFYGDTSHGYVARGKVRTDEGLLLATNDGILIESLPGTGKGFVTTDQFDGSSQVYYLDEVGGHLYAKTGVFNVGSKRYFGRPDQGYIVRGKTAYGDGMIIAAADGSLFFQDADGFVVTDEVDGVLERYYIVTLSDGVKGARLGLFTVGSDQYYGREDQGYVVRGSYTAPDGRVIYGDEDGKITYSFLTLAGWAAWDKVKAYPGGLYSFTQYLLLVDTTNNRTVVFQGSYIPSLGWYGNWAPLYDWACSTGNKIYHNGEGTPHDTYRIGWDNADWNWNESGIFTPGGYRTTYWAINDVRYFTGFILNLGFHSTVGWSGGYSDPGQLGKNITHGCIRLLEDCAKWIYYNCGVGTKVYVY